MPSLAPKRPTEVRRYVFDFERDPDFSRDVISAYQLTVTGGAVAVNSSEQFAPKAIVALLGGGLDGATSTLELQITTESGQLIIRDYSILTANALAKSGSLPSSTTKGQLVNKAFVAIGLPGYEFDATPQEQADALLGLDILMAELASPGENLDLGYNFPTAMGGSGMADISGVPDLAVGFIAGRLGQAIAPGIGKTLSIEARAAMARSERALRATLSRIPLMRPTRQTPRGAGAKPWSTWWPFVGQIGEGFPSSEGVLGTESGNIIETEGGDDIGV